MNGTVGIKEGERSTWENVKRMSYSSSSWSSTSNYGDDSISSTQPRYGRNQTRRTLLKRLQKQAKATRDTTAMER